MGDTLKQKTTKGLFWGILNNGTTQLLNLVIGVVLARLLTPADYGIVGVLTIFTTLAGDLQSAGFTQALINIKEPKSSDYNSVFWFNILVSISIYALLFLSAPLIADYFHQECLTTVSRVTFLTFVISAMGIAQNAYLSKHLMVKEQTIAGTVALVVSGVVGIVMAVNGMTYWSLVGQQITYIATGNIVRFYYCAWKPSLNITFAPIRSMFAFAVNMLLTKIINTLSANVLTFVFGRMYPIHAVGNFTQANKWNIMASSLLNGTVQQIAQPILTQVTDDKEREHRVFRKMLRFMAFASFPTMMCLSIVSEEFISIVLGYKWMACAPLLQVLCLTGAVLPITSLYQNLAISSGRSDIYLRLNVLQIIGQLILIYAVASRGILMMVNIYVIYVIAFLFIWHLAIGRRISYRINQMLHDLLPYTIATILAHTASWMMAMIIPLEMQVPLLLFAVKCVVFVVIYLGVLFATKDAILHETLGQILRKGQSAQ